MILPVFVGFPLQLYIKISTCIIESIFDLSRGQRLCPCMHDAWIAIYKVTISRGHTGVIYSAVARGPSESIFNVVAKGPFGAIFTQLYPVEVLGK